MIIDLPFCRPQSIHAMKAQLTILHVKGEFEALILNIYPSEGNPLPRPLLKNLN